MHEEIKPSDDLTGQLKTAHELLRQAMRALTGGDAILAPSSNMAGLVQGLQTLVARIHEAVEDRHQREREIMRADQLAVVGQMAAGVAHELRNPLTSIKMLVQSGQKEDASALTSDDLAIIEHEIRRLERSLQRFLDFARPPTPERRALDLAEVVEKTLALIQGRAEKQQVSVHFDRPRERLVAEVDQDQIEQLLLNLMLNSLDVMPDGGSLTVDLAPQTGGRVVVQVCDTGPGIPPLLLPRLFDPFISTKETGIGLGLAVSHRIATSHGGTLSAFNNAAGGACFVLTLNRVDQ
jgi:signal transduction histidine kinase